MRSLPFLMCNYQVKEERGVCEHALFFFHFYEDCSEEIIDI